MISLLLTGRDHHNDLFRRQLRGHGRTCSSGHLSRVNYGLLHRKSSRSQPGFAQKSVHLTCPRKSNFLSCALGTSPRPWTHGDAAHALRSSGRTVLTVNTPECLWWSGEGALSRSPPGLMTSLSTSVVFDLWWGKVNKPTIIWADRY